MKIFDTIAVMGNGFKIRVNGKSDPRNIQLFSHYVAEEIIDLTTKRFK